MRACPTCGRDLGTEHDADDRRECRQLAEQEAREAREGVRTPPPADDPPPAKRNRRPKVLVPPKERRPPFSGVVGPATAATGLRGVAAARQALHGPKASPTP